jgi:hypothetical protein
VSIVVSWPTVTLGCVVLAAGVLACVTYYFLDRQRIAAADRRQRREFEREMRAVQLPDYNGNTYDPPPATPPYGYDWTPESLAYLADEQVRAEEEMAAGYLRSRPAVKFAYEPFGGQAPTSPFPVPDSTLSGPLPMISTNGSDDFMARLRAENTEFLARLDTPAGA